MENQLLTVKEETESVLPPVCPLCQEDLPSLAWPHKQVPQCQGCRNLEPQSWLSSSIEALVLPTERPYNCSFCPKCFKRASDRRDHERVHTGERPYECGICGKRFTQSSVLSGHMRIHTGERPFHCGVCFKSFNNGSNFRKHQRIHGPLSGYSDGRAGGKDCDSLCGKKPEQVKEGKDGRNLSPTLLLSKQSDCRPIIELREGKNKADQNFQGRQSCFYNTRLSQDDYSNSSQRQSGGSMDTFKRMRLQQDDASLGINLAVRQSSQDGLKADALKKETDSSGHVGELGGNNHYHYSQEALPNGHSFKQLPQASTENPTESSRQNRSGGSHIQEEQKQVVDSCPGKLQLEGGSSWGKGFLPVADNRGSARKPNQESSERGFGVRRPNGLRGLKQSRGGRGGTEMRQNGRVGCDAGGLKENRTLVSEPNNNQRTSLGGLRERELAQESSTYGDFQTWAPEKLNILKVEPSTWPKDGIAREDPASETDDSEGSSPSPKATRSPWQLENPDPCSIPSNAGGPERCHSLQDQPGSTARHREDKERPTPSFLFPARETSDGHALSMLESKPFLCFACPKQFRRATDLKEHLRVHTGERPFGCSVCGKRFTQSSALTTHRRLHTGEKPFECAVCCRCFNNSSNFAKHRRIHGPDSVGHRNKAVGKELWKVKPH